MEASEFYITPHFERRWFTKEIDDVSIEYIRTDAFIEKACEWLDSAIYDYLDTGSIGDFETLRGVKNEQFLEDFRKAMKP